MFTITAGAKYHFALPEASPTSACTSAMTNPMDAANPVRACRRSQTNAATVTAVAAAMPVPRPIAFQPR